MVDSDSMWSLIEWRRLGRGILNIPLMFLICIFAIPVLTVVLVVAILYVLGDEWVWNWDQMFPNFFKNGENR